MPAPKMQPLETPPKRTVPKPTPPPKPGGRTAAAPKPTRTFKVSPWTGEGEGEKIIAYGDTGIGKTTLMSMLPNPIFIGVDDGGRRIVNPKTDKPVDHVPGIDTFEDVRAAIHQPNLFPAGSSCVIDTLTRVEVLAERFVLDTIPKASKGKGAVVLAKNLKDYGYNEGSSHVRDTFRMLLQDLDTLVRRGVNVGMICQEQAITVANPEGSDYLRACPRLHHDKQYSTMLEVCEWADHILRVGYLRTMVDIEADRSVGKAQSDATRAIFVGGAQDFLAKSRTLGLFVDDDGSPVSCVSFANPADGTIWEYIFDQEGE